MPLFDFKCPECGKVEEKLVRSSDPPPICEECDKEMDKILSTSGQTFRLYGEGFYRRTHKDTGEFS